SDKYLAGNPKSAHHRIFRGIYNFLHIFTGFCDIVGTRRNDAGRIIPNRVGFIIHPWPDVRVDDRTEFMGMSDGTRIIIVKQDDDGQRLDRWIKRHVPDMPYVLAQKLMRKGAIRVNGKTAKTDTRLE